MATPVGSVGAVVVNHDGGHLLRQCVASLRAEAVDEIVVVDNASSDGSIAALRAAEPEVVVVETGTNLGYGAGANRGLAAVTAEFVLVANPDVRVHRGSLSTLAAALRADATLAIAGPRIDEPDGTRYPSARRFPSVPDAAGHALLGLVVPGNRFTRRYRMADLEAAVPTPVDWVSGACFLVRRQAFEELGGFDEGYFMYAEDVDLCWRAHSAGWGVVYVPGAVVTHLQGHATARHPYRMLVAHHRSAVRFAARSATGWRRALVPLAGAALAGRLLIAVAAQAVRSVQGGRRGWFRVLRPED